MIDIKVDFKQDYYNYIFHEVELLREAGFSFPKIKNDNTYEIVEYNRSNVEFLYYRKKCVRYQKNTCVSGRSSGIGIGLTRISLRENASFAPDKLPRARLLFFPLPHFFHQQKKLDISSFDRNNYRTCVSFLRDCVFHAIIDA